MPTPAQNRAVAKYERGHYEKILLRLKNKETAKEGELIREDIQKAADQAGESINQYILEAVKMRIRCDKTDRHT